MLDRLLYLFRVGAVHPNPDLIAVTDELRQAVSTHCAVVQELAARYEEAQPPAPFTAAKRQSRG